ncbi:MAG: hypothetical protein AABZ30_05230 [Myxococcota bacterium]
MVGSRPAALLALGAWSALTACAASAPHVSSPATTTAAPRSLAGVWVWTHRSVDPIGDVHVEDEAWQLEETPAGQLRGHYDRTVTSIASDGRPYRCNGALTFTRKARYQIEGGVKDRRVTLRETDYEVETGPCEDGRREIDTYEGWLDDAGLLLRWPGGEHALRRPAWRPDEPLPAPPSVAGAWSWEHRGIDPEGDRRVEREDWVLEQDGDAIRGHYESVVTLTSASGQPFACGGAAEYATQARFEIAGRIEGGKVHLKEVGVAVQPGPCEPGPRRLGSYIGTIEEPMLLLDWGSGRQTLRRK